MKHLLTIFGAIALAAGCANAMASNVAAGKAKYAICAGCHGPTGAGNAALGYPRLSGKDAGFIAEQLRAYKSGKRDNATMKALTAPLNNADIDNLAAYVATLK
jgi:cytochrome c553